MKALPSRFYGDPANVVDELREMRRKYEARLAQDEQLSFKQWLEKELTKWRERDG